MITDPNPGIHMKIIPMSLVLEGESCDQWCNGTSDVPEILDMKRSDPGYPELLDSIKTHGFAPGLEPCVDVDVDPKWIGEGHHRIAALVELGAQWCPIQSDKARGRYFELPDGTRPAACTHCGPECEGCWNEDGW